MAGSYSIGAGILSVCSSWYRNTTDLIFEIKSFHGPHKRYASPINGVGMGSTRATSSWRPTRLNAEQDPMAKPTLPDFAPPMMAESAKAHFDSQDWIFEIKLDGYRAITVFDSAGKAHLWSRNGLSLCRTTSAIRRHARPSHSLTNPVIQLSSNYGIWPRAIRPLIGS